MQDLIKNNEKQKRFELLAEGEVSYIQYNFYKGNIAFMHTVVPSKNRGKGIATVLAKFALNYAEVNKIK